jgi:nucleoside-diphosphate-sugar epimerase
LENNLKLIHLGSVVGQKPFVTEVAYSISKLASQNLVEDYSLHKGLKAIVLNLCVIYNKQNNTHRHGARYPVERLAEDIENIIKSHDFTNYKLLDYSNTRA